MCFCSLASSTLCDCPSLKRCSFGICWVVAFTRVFIRRYVAFMNGFSGSGPRSNMHPRQMTLPNTGGRLELDSLQTDYLIGPIDSFNTCKGTNKKTHTHENKQTTKTKQETSSLPGLQNPPPMKIIQKSSRCSPPFLTTHLGAPFIYITYTG